MQSLMQDITKVTMITEEILRKIFLVLDLYKLVSPSSQLETTPKRFIFNRIKFVKPFPNPS